jgi:hypothetical protein
MHVLSLLSPDIKTYFLKNKMHTVYLLYIQEIKTKSTDTQDGPNACFPASPVSSFSLKYPLMWFGTTTCINLSNTISDKKGVYTKFKNQSRYYKEFMELFKYLDNHSSIDCPYGIYLKVIERGILAENLELKLRHHLFVYRMFYGSALILSNEYRVLLQKELDQCVSKKVVSTDLEDQRKRMNEKSRKYYEKNKAKIKAKRDSKKSAVIANTAQLIS